MVVEVEVRKQMQVVGRRTGSVQDETLLQRCKRTSDLQFAVPMQRAALNTMALRAELEA